MFILSYLERYIPKINVTRKKKYLMNWILRQPYAIRFIDKRLAEDYSACMFPRTTFHRTQYALNFNK